VQKREKRTARKAMGTQRSGYRNLCSSTLSRYALVFLAQGEGGHDDACFHIIEATDPDRLSDKPTNTHAHHFHRRVLNT